VVTLRGRYAPRLIVSFRPKGLSSFLNSQRLRSKTMLHFVPHVFSLTRRPTLCHSCAVRLVRPNGRSLALPIGHPSLRPSSLWSSVAWVGPYPHRPSFVRSGVAPPHSVGPTPRLLVSPSGSTSSSHPKTLPRAQPQSFGWGEAIDLRRRGLCVEARRALQS
jgi:hypothetical protein